jgi:hypothetical protein
MTTRIATSGLTEIVIVHAFSIRPVARQRKLVASAHNSSIEDLDESRELISRQYFQSPAIAPVIKRFFLAQ